MFLGDIPSEYLFEEAHETPFVAVTIAAKDDLAQWFGQRVPRRRRARSVCSPFVAERVERAVTPAASSGAAPSGFDAAADRYDSDEAGNRVLVHMRERVFRQLSHAFAPGSRLVELGSGTGTDAARLASERGCRVALVDVSPRLLERAEAKVQSASGGRLLGAHCMPARSVRELTQVYARNSFDGAYSNFGPLNCESDLRPVADGLAELVRPDGAVVLSIINRWCPTEVGWYALHRQWREATRRWNGPVRAAAYPGGPKDVLTFYYSSREVERAFASWFRVEHVEALPLLWPPPYLDFLVDRFDRLYRSLERFEERASRATALRQLGDHTLLRLRRRS
jgi:SAM-dependent methyltransferase